MDDLPALGFSIHPDPNGLAQIAIRIIGRRYDQQGALREASTRIIRQFLLMFLQNEEEPHVSMIIHFQGVYLEPAFVSALKQCLRRHTTRKVIFSEGCYGAGFELALCTVFKCHCRSVVIDRQPFNFTPTLADALGNSSSLRRLSIGRYSLDERNMKLLALSLCQNHHIRTLVLHQAFEGDASIVAFASYMHGMTSLRKMRLWGNEFGTSGEQALFKVLEEAKTSVSQLLLQGKPDHIQAHIDFLLRLKQKGGQSYIGSCDPNQWIELLVEFKDDMNALYYILRADPGRISN
jgi:hypothetical protein